MTQYIDKSALVAEIEKMIADETESIKSFEHGKNVSEVQRSNVRIDMLMHIRSLIDTIEVKEVDLEGEQRMKECPYRQVGCTMYEDKVLECNGACSWVVDYPKLKELKARKGE